MENRDVLFIGCGDIGSKRAISLLSFHCNIRIISPEVTNEIKTLVNEKKLQWINRPYRDKDIIAFNPFLVIAATNNREVNNRVMKEAKSCNTLAIISDNRQECSAYFPAIAENQEYIMGITSKKGNHKGVKNLAIKVRELLNR